MKHIIALCYLLLFVSCGSESRAGGTSSHENVIHAQIIDAASQPVEGAQVWLRNADASIVMMDTSNQDGSVEFGGLKSGTYYIESRALASGSFTEISTGTDSLWALPLAPLGAIKHCLDSSFAGDTLRITGLDRNAILDEVGCAIFDSLPVADYQFQIGDQKQLVVAQHGLRISIPASTPISTPFWIPIRFAANDLDYTQQNIAILSAQSKPLGFDVEEWDPTPGSATIWVRLDSLPASGASISLVQLTDSSSHQGAFELENDAWIHVWHFMRKDTTGFANQGSLDGSGMLGGARLFTSRSQSFRIANDARLANQGLISFWARLDSLNLTLATTLLQSQSIVLRVNPTATASELEALLMLNSGDTLSLISSVPVGNEGWHLIALQWDATNSATLYVDGAEEASKLLTTALRPTTDSLQVGSFLGAIDELRLGAQAQYPAAAHALDARLQLRDANEITWSAF